MALQSRSVGVHISSRVSLAAKEAHDARSPHLHDDNDTETHKHNHGLRRGINRAGTDGHAPACESSAILKISMNVLGKTVDPS